MHPRRAKFIELWLSGATNTEIASEMGYKTIKTAAQMAVIYRRQGVNLPKRVATTIHRKFKLTDKQRNFTKLWNAGVKSKHIAQTLNIPSVGAVLSFAYYLRKKGLPLKSRSPNGKVSSMEAANQDWYQGWEISNYLPSRGSRKQQTNKQD